jgi:hypothetical protein
MLPTLTLALPLLWCQLTQLCLLSLHNHRVSAYRHQLESRIRPLLQCTPKHRSWPSGLVQIASNAGQPPPDCLLASTAVPSGRAAPTP